MTRKDDEKFMRLALKEARKGLGQTSPNPCVGAVIVNKGRIIATGYHKKSGAAHAEINAIKNASESSAGATIYISLEPCSHTGRTPPCTRAIIKAGFFRVVVGMLDPNPKVNGRGISFLQEHGIPVTVGVLEEECRTLLLPYLKYIIQKIPWVIMKAGLSLDGRLSYRRGQGAWITGEQVAMEVHKNRNKVDAILVGRGTVEIDNPELTTRLLCGKRKDPIRIVVDSNLSTPLTSKIYNLDSQSPTWVFCARDAAEVRKTKFRELGIKVIPIDRGKNGLFLGQLLEKLGQEGICSLLLEGGSRLHGAFLRERLIDCAQLFYAPLFAGDQGVPLIEGYQAENRSLAIYLTKVIYRKIGEDFLISGELLYDR